MSAPVPTDPEFEPSTTDAAPAQPAHAEHGDHLDPITGEPHAHPVGVGVGAMGAGAVGAAIGAFLGPVGVVVGAAIGAIAGGLAGKEVAEEPEISPNGDDGVPLDEFEHAPVAVDQDEIPLSSTLSERTEPADDSFFTGGTLSGREPEMETSPSASTPSIAGSTAAAFASASPVEDEPLPTASSGLVTPERSGFFADSTTGESSVLAESPFPAARAVNAEGTSGSTGSFFAHEDLSSSALPTSLEGASSSAGGSSTSAEHSDAEHTIRTSAYYRYLDRETNGLPGSDLEDWVAAEKEGLRG